MRKIWVILFFMGCKRKDVDASFMKSVKRERHGSNIKGFDIFFFKKGVPRIFYLIFATAKGIICVRVLPWIEV